MISNSRESRPVHTCADSQTQQHPGKAGQTRLVQGVGEGGPVGSPARGGGSARIQYLGRS